MAKDTKNQTNVATAPVIKWQSGRMHIDVFNNGTDEKPLLNTKISNDYTDKDKEWQHNGSFSPRELGTLADGVAEVIQAIKETYGEITSTGGKLTVNAKQTA